MAIGIMAVLGTAGATSMYYATAGARTSDYSNTKTGTFSLSEAGIASVMSVLNNPTTNALDPDALCPTGQHTPCSQTTTYTNGTVTWSGVLNRSTAVWDVTSIGSARNSSASPSKVTQKLTAKVTVTPTNTQPLNNPSWNYMFATRTGNTCDETLANNVGGASRMYVAGNLCLGNNANLAPSALVVLGDLSLNNNSSVGAATNMSTRSEAYVGGRCQYGGGAWATPCSGNQDANNIFSKKNPPSYIVGVNNSPTLLVAPTTDFPGWYENSIPGPSQSCTTTSGTPPVFDNNYPTRDNSVATPRRSSLPPPPTRAASGRRPTPAARSRGMPARRSCSLSRERSSSTAAPRSPTALPRTTARRRFTCRARSSSQGSCAAPSPARPATSPAGTRTPRCSRS